MFYTYVLCRNHLTVEHNVFGAVLFVLLLDNTKEFLHEVGILRCIFDLEAEELSGFDETVDTDSEVLTTDVDVTGIEERKHTFLLERLEVLVVSELNFVHEINDIFDVCLVRDVITYGILDSAVEVDGKYGLRTRRYTTGTEGIAETVVGDGIT